jgi:hypothetical protein
VDAFGLEGGGDVVVEAVDLLEFDPGGGMELVLGDGGPAGDVAGGDLCTISREFPISSSLVSVGLTERSGIWSSSIEGSW